MKMTTEPVDLTQWIKEGVELQGNKQHFTKPDEIHVTEISSCPIITLRHLARRFDLPHVKKTEIDNNQLNFSELKYFHIGKMFHKNIEELLLTTRRDPTNIQIENKIKVPIYYTEPLNDPNGKIIRANVNAGKIFLTGTPDVLIDNVPYDLKTTFSLNYIIDKVPPEYLIQITLYANILNAKIGHLVFIEKSTFNMRQVGIPIRINILPSVLRMITKLINGQKVIHPENCICNGEESYEEVLGE